MTTKKRKPVTETAWAIVIGKEPQHLRYFMLSNDGYGVQFFDDKKQAKAIGGRFGRIVRVQIRELP